MNNEMIVGSIIAVAILIGVSFTSVVGFQSVKSNSVKASPLFTVRTKRAIDEESEDLTCDYVGKGKDTTIPFPTSSSRSKILKKAVDLIRKMDDERFNRFLESVESELITYDDTEMNILEVTESLKYLRGNENLMKNYKINRTDITAYCGPTLGLGIFNCPYEFTIRYGGQEFSGFGCLGFLSVFVFCIILAIWIAITAPPTCILVCPPPVT